ncbi:hypothetical protein B9Z55_012836 [Caenorhabditis nigoni]|nr:hypothetical protein B9Z55_012836 [Caenorhabditis nigoni]
MLPFKENDNQKKRKQSLTHSAPRRKPSMMTLKARIQSRRREVDSGRKPLDKKIIAEQLAKIDEKETHKDFTRPSLLAEFLSEKDAPSTSNQNPNLVALPPLSLSTDCPSYSAMVVTQQASNRSRSASQAPAPSSDPTETEETVGRNAEDPFAINAPSEPIEIEYDVPEASTPFVNPTQTDGTSSNNIDDIIDRIARGDDSGTEEQSAEQSSTRKIIPRRKPVRALAKEYWIGQNGTAIGNAQRNVPQTKSVEKFLAEIHAKNNLPPMRLGVGNMGTSHATRNSSSSQSEAQPEVSATNARNSVLLEMDEDTGVEENLRMNTPDYSHSPAPRREEEPSTSTWNPIHSEDSYFFVPATIGYHRPSSSSQASSASLPNLVPADRLTHGTTLSIAPPPRMLDAIMKRVSNEMKQREESGSLDFGPIQVQLTATGKELDDSISFLNNLIGQLESAKRDQ